MYFTFYIAISIMDRIVSKFDWSFSVYLVKAHTTTITLTVYGSISCRTPWYQMGCVLPFTGSKWEKKSMENEI